MYKKNPLLQESMVATIWVAKNILLGFILVGLGSSAYRDHVMKKAYEKIASKYPDARSLYAYLKSNPKLISLASELESYIDMQNYDSTNKYWQKQYSKFIGNCILKDRNWKYYLSFMLPEFAIPYHMYQKHKIKKMNADDIIELKNKDSITNIKDSF